MSSRRSNPPSFGNRFYTVPPVLRHQQMQQQPQVLKESAANQAEKCSGSTGDSIPAVERSATPSVFSPSASKVTNLDRLMESVAPLVPSRDSSEVSYLQDSRWPNASRIRSLFSNILLLVHTVNRCKSSPPCN